MDDGEDIFNVRNKSCENLVKKDWNGIFQDSFVLDQPYIPPKLISRDKQIRQVASLFQPIFNGSSPFHAMAQGLSGTGKSVVLRYVVNRLNKELINLECGQAVKLVSVQCNVSSISKVLRSILYQMDPDRSVPKQGVSISDYVDTILEIMNKKEFSLVLVLDEFDKIPRPEILYPLVRAYEQEQLKPGIYLTVIGVLNDMSFYSTLEPRIISSMGAEKIDFPPYSANELIQILEGRRHAFRPGVLDDDVIPYCAAISARERGDAREAIQLLKKAGVYAVKQGSPVVTLEHIEYAKYLLDEAPDYDTINALAPTHRIALCSYIALKDEGVEDVWTGDLYKKYLEICQALEIKPVVLTRFSTTISGMEMLGVIETDKMCRGRKGLSRKITLEPAIKGIRAVLMQDPQFRPLLESKL